jgi:chromatin segregation and condensation protein Rec8/ScpA/Scc1 (kleisin family)
MDFESIVQELVKKEEIEWEDIIDSLITQGYIEPTNIDINLLIDYYIKIVKELKKKENFDFVLTSKVLLLLVFFLKLKIEYLSKEIYGFEEREEEFYFEENEEVKEKKVKKRRKKKELDIIIKLDR